VGKATCFRKREFLLKKKEWEGEGELGESVHNRPEVQNSKRRENLRSTIITETIK